MHIGEPDHTVETVAFIASQIEGRIDTLSEEDLSRVFEIVDQEAERRRIDEIFAQARSPRNLTRTNEMIPATETEKALLDHPNEEIAAAVRELMGVDNEWLKLGEESKSLQERIDAAMNRHTACRTRLGELLDKHYGDGSRTDA